MANLKTFSVSFFLKKNRFKENGEVPLILRITVNGKVGDFSMSVSVNTKNWNQKNEKYTGKDRLSQEINTIRQIM